MNGLPKDNAFKTTAMRQHQRRTLTVHRGLRECSSPRYREHESILSTCLQAKAIRCTLDLILKTSIKQAAATQRSNTTQFITHRALSATPVDPRHRVCHRAATSRRSLTALTAKIPPSTVKTARSFVQRHPSRRYPSLQHQLTGEETMQGDI